MLCFVQGQEFQNGKLGHATLLYGSRELSVVNLPAMKFVRLGVLARLGTDKVVYFYHYQLFKVCLVLHVLSASVGECWRMSVSVFHLSL